MVLARKDCRDPSMGLANAHVFHRIAAMHGRSCVKNCFSKCHSRQSPMCLTLSQTMRKKRNKSKTYEQICQWCFEGFRPSDQWPSSAGVAFLRTRRRLVSVSSTTSKSSIGLALFARYLTNSSPGDISVIFVISGM